MHKRIKSRQEDWTGILDPRIHLLRQARKKACSSVLFDVSHSTGNRMGLRIGAQQLEAIEFSEQIDNLL